MVSTYARDVVWHAHLRFYSFNEVAKSIADTA